MKNDDLKIRQDQDEANVDSPDYDPTPWCTWCGAEEKEQCDCGPIAENY